MGVGKPVVGLSVGLSVCRVSGVVVRCQLYDVLCTQVQSHDGVPESGGAGQGEALDPNPGVPVLMVPLFSRTSGASSFFFLLLNHNMDVILKLHHYLLSLSVRDQTSVKFKHLLHFITLSTRLKDDILLPQPATYSPTIPPAAGSPAIQVFLSAACPLPPGVMPGPEGTANGDMESCHYINI
jgi:hypothetical protein